MIEIDQAESKLKSAASILAQQQDQIKQLNEQNLQIE